MTVKAEIAANMVTIRENLRQSASNLAKSAEAAADAAAALGEIDEAAARHLERLDVGEDEDTPVEPISLPAPKNGARGK